MREPHFLCSTPDSADIVARPEPGERVMWRGRVGLAEYAFEQHGSLPRWTLPESTQVLVTDRRVVFAHNPDQPGRATGEVRWLWPQYLRLQPGARSPDRGAAASQIQLVCASTDGSFPALVLAGGDLKTVADADKLANALRLAIARYRVDHADWLGLAEPQTRMLSRLLIGPEFSNQQGGEGQTVSLAGAQLVADPAPRPAAAPPTTPADPARRPTTTPPPDPASRPTTAPSPSPASRPTTAPPPDPASRPTTASPAPPAEQAGAGYTGIVRMPQAGARPGREADADRARRASRSEEAHQQSPPDLAWRASEIAARVADMVSRSAESYAQREPEPYARREADAKAQREADAKAQREAEPHPRREAEPHPRREAEPQPRREAEPNAQREAEAKADADPEPAADEPTADQTERAERLRRSAVRFNGNSARGRAGSPARDADGAQRVNRNY